MKAVDSSKNLEKDLSSLESCIYKVGNVLLICIGPYKSQWSCSKETTYATKYMFQYLLVFQLCEHKQVE